MLKCPSRQNESPLQDGAAIDLSKVLVPISTEHSVYDEDDLQKAYSSRRRSCALANTPSLCVNKAIHHIRELKRKLENCEQSANLLVAQKTVDSKVERVSRSSEFSAAQCVEDFGSCLSESHSTLKLLQNEVGGVLVEVMRLIGRLAADWQEAEKALEVEQERQRSLQMKIDGLSLGKQQHFPATVERENETCTSDITEIRTHVKLKKERPEEVRQRLAQIEMLNRQLNTNVAFIEESGPVIKEKLKLKAQDEKHAEDRSVLKLEEDFNKQKEFQAICEKNTEYEPEMEESSRKTAQSGQVAKQLRSDRKRMLLQISHNKEQTYKANAELSHVAATHSATKARLEGLEPWSLTTELEIRDVTENMKKMTMDIMKEQEILKGKISVMKVELDQEQSNPERTSKEQQAELEEAKIEELKQNLHELQMKHKATNACLEQEKDMLQVHLSVLQERHEAATRQYEQTQSQVEELSARSKAYRADSDTTRQGAATKLETIKDLQNVFDVVNFKHKSTASVMRNLQKELAGVTTRMAASVQIHASLSTNRRWTMEHTKKQLAGAFRENAALAQEYRHLQRTLLSTRREALSAYDLRNTAEASFHDRKQLSLLQKRTHTALVDHFRRRSLHSRAALALFQARSSDNDQKIASVQMTQLLQTMPKQMNKSVWMRI
ncbi:coiled-coil domain-containing protein 178 isoform X2 [Brienomyrus brachyistius]|uniref:coiled-coil domain-containing protein 178 isoform X2 n=1 Tax=Brienomyrus brachyistius TaxID=42636 RepID=UPI0020B2E774|nr:coiled-coil domain-containing protein 178 isoform X2 [Brienomyrus brachyistius]